MGGDAMSHDSRRITLWTDARARNPRPVPVNTPHTTALPSVQAGLPLPRRNPSHPLSVFKFRVGDPCFIRGKPHDKLFTVVQCFTHDSGFPHYVVRDAAGDRYRVSQLLMSYKAIKDRK